MFAHNQPVLPQSAVPHWLALVSLLLCSIVLYAFRTLQPDVTTCLPALVAAVALPHMLQQMPKIWVRVKTGNRFSLQRIGVKLLGLTALFSVVLLAYLVFRGFTQDYLQPLLHMPHGLIVGLLFATPIYIVLTDRVMDEPEDALARLGRNVLGRAGIETDRQLQQFLLGWLVKGFFGPLMIVFATNDLHDVFAKDISATLAQQGGWYELGYQFIYFFDVIFAATGYLCTFKLFDAHIRSAEPTLFGWLVCIACYPPFWNVLTQNFFAYDHGQSWGDWLQQSPVLYTLWGIAITACIVIYVWATISFGMRFSNLTHRGIITSGPYRFIKHPAYVSKNLSWWLISVPFIPAGDVWQSLLDCLALAMVNGIYFLRAVTEERHLGRDPVYLAYGAWLAEHGLVARVRRLIKPLMSTSK